MTTDWDSMGEIDALQKELVAANTENERLHTDYDKLFDEAYQIRIERDQLQLARGALEEKATNLELELESERRWAQEYYTRAMCYRGELHELKAESAEGAWSGLLEAKKENQRLTAERDKYREVLEKIVNDYDLDRMEQDEISTLGWIWQAIAKGALSEKD
jgi:hypothetical protein